MLCIFWYYFIPATNVLKDAKQLLVSAVEEAVEVAKEGGIIILFEWTKDPREYIPGKYTNAYTYFHHYLYHFDKTSPQAPNSTIEQDFQDLTMLHIWPNYFEAYHNHWQRYIGK